MKKAQTNRRNVIGFDLDGTIAESWISNRYWHNFFLRFHSNFMFRKLANWKIKRLNPIMIPIGWCYVITSRPPWTFDASRLWLIENDINYCFLETASQYWHYQSQERIIEKARAINNFNITEYYEDELDTRLQLITRCPNTKILQPEEAIERGRAIYSTNIINCARKAFQKEKIK